MRSVVWFGECWKLHAGEITGEVYGNNINMPYQRAYRTPIDGDREELNKRKVVKRRDQHSRSRRWSPEDLPRPSPHHRRTPGKRGKSR